MLGKRAHDATGRGLPAGLLAKPFLGRIVGARELVVPCASWFDLHTNLNPWRAPLNVTQNWTSRRSAGPWLEAHCGSLSCSM